MLYLLLLFYPFVMEQYYKYELICKHKSHLGCSILIYLTGKIKKNLRPKTSSCEKFSACHSNLNSIWAHSFIKISLLCAFISTHNFDILCSSETYVDYSISTLLYPENTAGAEKDKTVNFEE